MAGKRSRLSYLLRLWRVRSGKEQAWRALLEVPGTGERYGFANLRDLFAFLEAQTELEDDQDETERKIY